MLFSLNIDTGHSHWCIRSQMYMYSVINHTQQQEANGKYFVVTRAQTSCQRTFTVSVLCVIDI